MSDKEPQAPNVLPLPASVSFETDTPTDGWWTIRVRILEEKFVDSQIIPWPKGASNKRRCFEFKIECSALCDPIPDLHEYIYDSANGYHLYDRWHVDEEGTSVTLESWHLTCGLDQIRFELIRNFDEDRVFDLLVDKAAFLTALEKAYCDFGRKGGWQLFGLTYFS